MWKYVLRRLLQMIPMLLGISIIVYVIIHIVPGNYVLNNAAAKKLSPAQIKNLEDLLGINDPIYMGYLKWLWHALHLDFGTSFRFQQPVTKVIGTYLPNSIKLAIPSLILELVAAIPLGIISATKRYSKLDITLTVIAFLLMSMPSFFLSYLVLKAFSVDIPIFPLSGLTTVGANYTGFANFLDQVYHCILPVLVLTVISIGGTMRYARTSMLEVIDQDYIRTARSKGLSEKVVIYKHAFRNAMIPIVTLLGFSLPGLFSGAMITETIFAIPGIGYISYQAVSDRDYPLLMAYLMLIAFLTLIGNLIADILYAVVDPRIKLK